MSCDFCHMRKRKPLVENNLAFAIFDRSPVNAGHILIIPKRHFKIFFEATSEEVAAMYDLMHQVKEKIDFKYQPDGYNIRINCGRTAGQTVMHMHIHLIPRYKGDNFNVTGGLKKLSSKIEKAKKK